MGNMATELGGTNVQGAAPEVRDLLEKGVIEAVTFPWGSLTLFGIDKVTKYHMDVPLYVTTLSWVMNKDKYNSMSDRQKKAVDDHCNNEWAERIAIPQADFENSGHAKIGALPDHEVYTLNADQIAAWRKATAPLETKWADAVKKTGGDPKAILDALKASLTKYDAAF
jgi:TRAP-type C4-dicarboxylate transport system substrate-binding protein